MVTRGVVCFVRQGYESNVVWKKHDMVIHLLTSMDRGLTNSSLRVLEKETRIKGSGTHLVTDK